MNEPIWLDVDEVIDMHAEQLAIFGGPEGIRHRGLLELAVLRSVSQWSDGQTDMAALAAAYAFGLARNHAFVDGNKRIAFIAATLFLERNGVSFTAPEAEATIAMLRVAEGSMNEKQLARWFHEHTTKSRRS